MVEWQQGQSRNWRYTLGHHALIRAQMCWGHTRVTSTKLRCGPPWLNIAWWVIAVSSNRWQAYLAAQMSRKSLWIFCANILNNILARLWRSCDSHSLWACRTPTGRSAKHPIGCLYTQFWLRIYLHQGQLHPTPLQHFMPHSWAHQNTGQLYLQIRRS